MFYKAVTKKFRLPIFLAIFALVFQSFIPLAHALSTVDTGDKPSGEGYYTILCTAKGFESVWVSTAETNQAETPAPDKPHYASPFKCPSCILGEATSVFLPGEQFSPFYADRPLTAALFYSTDDLPKQRHWKHRFSIRAPPLVPTV